MRKRQRKKENRLRIVNKNELFPYWSSHECQCGKTESDYIHSQTTRTCILHIYKWSIEYYFLSFTVRRRLVCCKCLIWTDFHFRKVFFCNIFHWRPRFGFHLLNFMLSAQLMWMCVRVKTMAITGRLVLWSIVRMLQTFDIYNCTIPSTLHSIQ